MIVIGLLLTAFVTSSLGQTTQASVNASIVNNNSTDDGNGTSPHTTGTPSSREATTNTTRSRSPNFGFDCRRWDASCGGRTCDLASGKCNCGQGNFSYNCQDITPDSTCNPACENGGICHTGKCVCTANFYGTNCNLTRAQVLCKDQQMFVNINPADNFKGFIYVQGHSSCLFSANSTSQAVDFKAELEKFPGIEGQSRVLEFTDSNSTCGNVSITSSDGGTSYVYKIYVQYMSSFKSAVDQIVVAECVVTNGSLTVSSSDVNNVTEGNGNLDEVSAAGKVDAVTLKVLSSDGKTPAKTVTLGDEIHLVFSMPISNGSKYTDFRLQVCMANNTLSNSSNEFKNLIFIEDGCPTSAAKAIFSGEPERVNTSVSITIDVTLKAFMFVGSSTSLGFICTVSLCPREDTGPCEKPCQVTANTIPSTPSTGDSTTQTPPVTPAPVAPAPAPAAPAASSGTTGKRRKRDTASSQKETTVGTSTVRVVAPGQQQEPDSPSSDNQETTCQKPEVKSCPVDQQFVAAVAILGVCVFLLLLLSGCLIFQLMKSKKLEPERPDHYPRPVEGLRFPRLELNSAHENAF